MDVSVVGDLDGWMAKMIDFKQFKAFGDSQTDRLTNIE